ncbi:hypothetical protein OUZ56_018690 [Daphnia magna]|uniref:Helicase ATP-binding domain-containing protein n=1 Tax=Daphnia magna TaxID=35525 RepID=A0ABQ9Z9H7_9CRUS|nr:hypothetical protein OUZ56_018690 [Daphnia magna]
MGPEGGDDRWPLAARLRYRADRQQRCRDRPSRIPGRRKRRAVAAGGPADTDLRPGHRYHQTRVRALIQQALAVAQADPDYAADFPGLGGPATLAALRARCTSLMVAISATCCSTGIRRNCGLVREEPLAHQLCMRLLRKQTKAAPGARIEAVLPAAAKLQEKLPFAMTGAQRRVISDIAHDLDAGKPMLRLVQGDVGSGKTVVAATAMLGAALSGLQSVLMAPTELLVEQHARTLTGWLGAVGIDVGLVTGKMKKAEREAALHRAVTGETPVWVGTHALFQGDMKFKTAGAGRGRRAAPLRRRPAAGAA